MFGQCLLLSTGISAVSTGVYATFTHDKYDTRDRKEEYITIFSIILTIAFIILFIFKGNSDKLVKIDMATTSVGDPIMGGGKPPF